MPLKIVDGTKTLTSVNSDYDSASDIHTPRNIIQEISGNNIQSIINTLASIASSIGASVPTIPNVEVVSGSSTLTTADLTGSATRTSVIFSNYTDMPITIKLNNSAVVSYILYPSQVYESTPISSRVAHAFSYLNSMPTTGSWHRTITY